MRKELARFSTASKIGMNFKSGKKTGWKRSGESKRKRGENALCLWTSHDACVPFAPLDFDDFTQNSPLQEGMKRSEPDGVRPHHVNATRMFSSLLGEQNLHRFKAESGTGELMRGSFCEGEKRGRMLLTARLFKVSE